MAEGPPMKIADVPGYEGLSPEEKKATKKRHKVMRFDINVGRGGRDSAEDKGTVEEGRFVPSRGLRERARREMEEEQRDPDYWNGLAESWGARADEELERLRRLDDSEEIREAIGNVEHAREQEEAAWVGMIRIEQTWEDGELQPGGRVWVEEDDQISAGWELAGWDGDEAVVRHRGDEDVQRRISREDLYQLNPPPEQRIQFGEELTREEVLQRTRGELTAQIEDAARELRDVYGGDDQEAIRRAQRYLRILQERADWLDTAEGGENPHHMQPHWLRVGESHELLSGGGIIVEVGGERRQCLLERYIDTDGSGAPDRVIAWDPVTNESQTVALEDLYLLNPRPGEEGRQWEAWLGQVDEGLAQAEQMAQPGWFREQAERREGPLKKLIRMGAEMGVRFFGELAQEAEEDLANASQNLARCSGAIREARELYAGGSAAIREKYEEDIKENEEVRDAALEDIDEDEQVWREDMEEFYGRWYNKLLFNWWFGRFERRFKEWGFEKRRRKAKRTFVELQTNRRKIYHSRLKPLREEYRAKLEGLTPLREDLRKELERLRGKAPKRRRRADRARGIARLLGVEVAVPAGAAA